MPTSGKHPIIAPQPIRRVRSGIRSRLRRTAAGFLGPEVWGLLPDSGANPSSLNVRSPLPVRVRLRSSKCRRRPPGGVLRLRWRCLTQGTRTLCGHNLGARRREPWTSAQTLLVDLGCHEADDRGVNPGSTVEIGPVVAAGPRASLRRPPCRRRPRPQAGRGRLSLHACLPRRRCGSLAGISRWPDRGPSPPWLPTCRATVPASCPSKPSFAAGFAGRTYSTPERSG